jgi:monoamine oxidase
LKENGANNNISVFFLFYLHDMKNEVIIIGAGLTGLTIAYLLQKKGIVATIIESRDRIGGRIHTVTTETNTDLELGATWFANGHIYLRSLLDEFKIRYFEQFQEGESALVYNSMVPAHRFVTPTNEEKSNRIENGSKAIIEALSKAFTGSIVLNEKIEQITDKGDYVELTSHTNKTYSATNVIVALPPKLIPSQIECNPELPSELITAMNATHTWMSDAMKFTLTYKTPFWKEEGKSGMVISQIGAATEVYDHCNYQQNQFALMGFINQNLRNYSREDRRAKIVAYLSEYLSSEAENYLDYKEKDWSLDEYTSTKDVLKDSGYRLPYGNPILNKKYMNDKLYFSGTETSEQFGGYMEGAILAAIDVANSF